MLKLLKELEWCGVAGGMTGGFGSGPEVSVCPICGGVKPDDPNAESMPKHIYLHGHADYCELMIELHKLGHDWKPTLKMVVPSYFEPGTEDVDNQ